MDAENDDIGVHDMEMELDAIDLVMMERLGVEIDKLDQLDLVEDVADNTPAMDKLPSPKFLRHNVPMISARRFELRSHRKTPS